jgi:hypothetical protein
MVLATCSLRGAGAQSREEADAHFKRGMQKVRTGDYATAVEEFEAAERIQPHPATLYNLAQAYVKLDRVVQAARALREYVRVDGVAADRRAHAERQLKDLARRVAILEVNAKPAGARLFVDGVEIGAVPLEGVVVEPGSHAVELRHDGYEPVRTTARLDAGSSVALELTLEPEAPPLRLGLGALRAECAVPGVSLEVDGQRRPDSPSVFMLEGGTHRIVFARAGYESSIHLVEVTPGGVTQSTCALRIDPTRLSEVGATLELTQEYPDLALVVDGERRSRVTRLPYGEHDVSIAKGGEILWTGSVRVAQGEHRLLDPLLVRDDASRKRSAPIAGYAVLGTGIATTIATAVIVVTNHNRHQAWQTEQDAIEHAWASGGAGDPELVARLNENDELYKRGQTWDRVAVGTAVASAALLTVGTGMILGWFDGSGPALRAQRNPE